MKVRIDNIEMVITHNDVEYQVGACWTGNDDTDDTYEVYYYKLWVEEPITFSWLVDSSGGILDENYPDTELSHAIMAILFNEDNPIIKEF